MRAYVWRQSVDTLSMLLQILGIIVNCAKIVAVLVLFTIVLAALRYVCLRFQGLLPTVAMTAFVFYILSVNIAQVCDFTAFAWWRLSNLLYVFSGGVTLLILLFTVLLCCAIATRLVVSSHSLFGLLKIKRKENEASVDACNMSNSYLAITPVLLS